MKKLFKIGAICLAAFALVACDPTEKDYDNNALTYTEGNLKDLVSFTQADKKGNPAPDGNYITYSAKTAVELYTLRSSGDKNVLAKGTGGSFVLAPARGSDPAQKVYIRVMNPDMTYVTDYVVLNVFVATDLTPEMKLVCSNSGTKVWKWQPTSVNGGAVWGNAGYQNAQNGNGGIEGSWWGCGPLDGECADLFDGQLQHSAVGAITGEEYLTAYMTFAEDGTITKYDKDGNVLKTGSFEIERYKGGEAIDEHGTVAFLNTDEGCILWPYAINMDGFQPKKFEIGYLSVDKMILIYAPEGTGGWGECTWWSFGNDDDAEGFLTSGKWGWEPTSVNGGAVWGNAGYQNAQNGNGGIEGSWWGCGPLDGVCADLFDGQLQHSAAGAITGEEYLTAWMEFSEDGIITKYDKDGNKMKEGKYTLDMNPTFDWNKGTLGTTAGSILWPYAINMDGFQPEAFEIGYISGNKMILIYAPEGTGGWGECTWWSFGKK